MTGLGVPEAIIAWYDYYLKNRHVSLTLGGTSKTIQPTRGSPQGGVLSRIVWNMIMNTLLSRFDKGPVRAVGYAGDIILCIGGCDAKSMADLMQEAINMVCEWGRDNGLTFNPAKTQVMLMTRKLKVNEPPLRWRGSG